MPEFDIDHDTWCHSPPKTKAQPKIVLGEIHGVLPFSGVRNPGSRSATSHHVWFTYRTEANDGQPRVGICESAAEFAVGLELLLDPDTYDVQFQPIKVKFSDPDRERDQHYTHDILFVKRNGSRRLIFVRNSQSLKKQRVWRQIDQIVASTAKTGFAHSMVVVDADTYSRQRRENLLRMWKISNKATPH
jgi:hypothetical protein